ncbi:MAG: T9SS type A sorting domain-containing protein [Flavobacteriaceae bacterium]
MKHLLLSASLLLFAGNLAAQTADLHVSPNGATDSYIYANDVVLYVENDIDLVVNSNDPETRASIYLRGDSQLIQGDKLSSTNSGNGSLSVLQRGTTNAYDYNYWASPVGNPNDPADGNTNFGIPRIFDVREDTTTPLTLSKTFSTQSPSTTALNGVRSDPTIGFDGTLNISRRWIYTMRAQSGYANWIYIGNQNGIGNGLEPGEGFTMKGTGTVAQVGNTNDQLYDFRGRPNDGNIDVAVAGTTSVYQETLTGNPYPSALDMAAFLLDSDNTEIDASAWYWESDPNVNSHYIEVYQGGYGVWQPGGGVDIGDGTFSGEYTPAVFIMYDGSGNSIPGDVGTGSAYERRFAPIGQGFMVRGEASGFVTFKNSMRRQVARGAVTYSEFRNPVGPSLTASSGPVTPPTEPEYVFPTLRFHLEVNEQYVREMVMIFNPEKTKGKDRGWDSKHPRLINNGDAFWKLEEETHPYVIQSRPFDEYDVIPLGLRVKNGTTNFVVKLVESHNFNNNMYLFDLVNNSYQRLDSENKASITHNGTAGKVEDRYFIVFRRGIQDDQIPNKIAEMNLDFFQNNRLSQLEVFNPETIDIKSASVYDMSGKLMIHEKNLGKQNTYIFSTANLSSGVYLVKLVTQDDIIVDYKVTVHNKN